MTFTRYLRAILGLGSRSPDDRIRVVSRDIRSEQVELMFAQLPMALGASLAVAAIVVVVLLPNVDGWVLAAWMTAVVAVLTYRLMVWREYVATPPLEANVDSHLNQFKRGALLAGAVWGTVCAFLPADNLLTQFFIGAIFAGLGAGGVTMLSSQRGVYPAFLLAMMVPYAVRMILVLDAIHVAVAAASLVYVAAMLSYSRRIFATLAESLQLRFENLELIDRLTSTKDHLEEANVLLQKEIAERRHAEDILMKSEQKLRLHAQQAPLAFVEWDLSFRVLEWNPAAEKMFGYSRQEALGRHAKSLIAATTTCETISVLWPRLLKEKQGMWVTVENRTKANVNIVCEWYYTPLVDPQGKVLSVMALARDVTASRQAHAQLRHKAYHDEMTGLPNRCLFNDRLSQAIVDARRQDRSVTVMLLDIDKFRQINERMGRDAGDALLRDIGKRLSVCVRESDTVARFEGDEFAIMLADAREPSDAIKVVQKILDAFAPPFFSRNREVYLTPSVGITIYPFDADDTAVLIANADSARYHAKFKGGGNYQFFSSEMAARAKSRFAVEMHLRNALERREFRLHYQPAFNLATGDMTGVEALIRWNNSEIGPVAPAAFIKLAEQNGLIEPIGEWVLRSACEQLANWEREGSGDIKLSINLSAYQLRQGRLKQLVSEVLSDTGIDPRRLKFEIPESILLNGGQAIRETLAELKDLSVTISLDDFGSGVSSLLNLRQFPIDTLKIDGACVRNIASNPDDAAIVRAIIALSHSLQIRVVAKSVETEIQRGFLHAEHCDEIQGMLCGRPVPAEEIVLSRRFASVSPVN